jgi:hypothetical protein
LSPLRGLANLSELLVPPEIDVTPLRHLQKLSIIPVSPNLPLGP